MAMRFVLEIDLDSRLFQEERARYQRAEVNEVGRILASVVGELSMLQRLTPEREHTLYDRSTHRCGLWKVVK